MNIEEVTIDHTKYEGKNFIEVFFEKQEELRKLYKIRLADLDVPADQELLKWFAWCVTEESAEVIEVLMTSDHHQHLIDEAADMWSFFIELLLVAKFSVDSFPKVDPWESQRDLEGLPKKFTDFITALAICMNTLKNRDWRQTNLKTDKVLFYKRLELCIGTILTFLKSTGLSFNELFDGYLRKHEVNLFRIRSKY